MNVTNTNIWGIYCTRGAPLNIAYLIQKPELLVFLFLLKTYVTQVSVIRTYTKVNKKPLSVILTSVLFVCFLNQLSDHIM